MKRSPLRWRLEYLGYRSVVRALHGLPHESVRAAGRRLGGIACHVDRSGRRRAHENLAMAMPTLDAARREAVVRDCYRNALGTFCELASMERLEPSEIEHRFDVEGYEHVEAAAALGRGLFVMAGHYGAWELAAFPLALRLGRAHLVVRPPNNPHVGAHMERIRERLGTHVIRRRGAGRRILAALRKGEAVGIAIDQRVGRREGIRVPFLGLDCWTTPLPAMLSIRTGAPVVPMRCLPAEPGRYRLTVEPPIHPPEVDDEAARRALTLRYLATVEADIRARPELWLWMHRRWRL